MKGLGWLQGGLRMSFIDVLLLVFMVAVGGWKVEGWGGQSGVRGQEFNKGSFLSFLCRGTVRKTEWHGSTRPWRSTDAQAPQREA
jgi:hypothetical protein